MKWNVSIGVRLSIDYDDIEAEDEEEAKQIARVRALEDVDFSNAELDEYGGITIYCAWPDEEQLEFEEN